MRDDRSFWEKTASGYDRSEEKDSRVYAQVIDILRSYLSPKYNMLDIGCGTGALHSHIADQVDSLHGIDYSENMIAIAKEKADDLSLSNITYSCTSIEELGLENFFYDIVTAFYVLHLLTDLDKKLQRIRSMLKDNGYFITVTPCMRDAKLIGVLLEVGGKIGILPRITRYSGRELLDIIEKNGFEIMDVKVLREKTHEYMIIAKKSKVESELGGTK